MSPAPPVTLAYRALGLGDLLTAVPALRALSTAHGPVTLAAPGWLEPVAGLLGLALLPVESLAALPPSPSAALPEMRLAVNLHGCGPQSTALLQNRRPAELWAYRTPGRPGGGPAADTGPSWDPDEHEVHRWCRLLAWFGLPADPGDLQLPAPPTEQLAAVPGRVTIVHPGGAAPARRWPANRWAAVVAGLQARGHRVMVTAAATELALAAAILSRAAALSHQADQGRIALVRTTTATPGPPARRLRAGPPPVCWQGDLLALCALVAQARLVLCADTGVGHLATAYATPSVVLFGPVPPARWGPPPGGRHRALGGACPSDPFAATTAPALLAVSPEEVLTAVDRQATLIG